MTTPIRNRKRTYIEMDSPEAPATASALTDNKTRGVAMPVVTETPTRTPFTPRNYSSNTGATLPVTPGTPPHTPRTARGIPQSSYQTPEAKRTTAVQARPSKKSRKIESEENFAKRCYGEKPVTEGFSPQIQETVKFLCSNLPNASIPEYCRLPSGRCVLAIQQPNPATSCCGPGCALMIAADHQKVEYAFDEQKFLQWYGKTEITNAKNMRNAFQMLKISCKVFQFTTDKDYALSEEDAAHYNLKRGKNSKDAIKFMKDTINNTKCSLITAITHPILFGHWVIIDEFNHGNVYGRCPRFGIAFCVSETKLAEWLFDQEDDPEIVQSMIIFPS